MQCSAGQKEFLMIFSEIYGKYYQAVAEILRQAVYGRLTGEKLYEISKNRAFAESVLAIPDALTDGTWPFLDGEMRTCIKNSPYMPLSLLERRWLKTILADKRIRLFFPDSGMEKSSEQGAELPHEIEQMLEGVEPMFLPEDIVYFDQYLDGDNYGDPAYIRNFSTVLAAIRDGRKIDISFTGGRGKPHRWLCIPRHLEYSAKDDKFRLAIDSPHEQRYINMARVITVSAKEKYRAEELHKPLRGKEKLVLELTDERKALERAMLLFSYLKKETRKIARDKYLITLHYDNDDATEILIRVLSFGPMIKVISPEGFKTLLLERLKKQKEIFAERRAIGNEE